MTTALKAELRKLLTVRSTYVVTILAFVMTAVVNFWAVGYKFRGEMAPTFLQGAVTTTLFSMAALPAVIAILLVTHEYRYNTIYYSLTATKSRTQLLLTKAAAVSLYSIGFTLVIGLVAMLAAVIGLQVGDHELVSQKLWDVDFLWRIFFYVWATVSLGLLFGLIIRNQIGTIVTYLMFQGTVENLIAFLVKGSGNYMPFMALNQVVMNGEISHGRAAAVVAVWLAVGLTAAWSLLDHRDAN